MRPESIPIGGIRSALLPRSALRSGGSCPYQVQLTDVVHDETYAGQCRAHIEVVTIAVMRLISIDSPEPRPRPRQPEGPACHRGPTNRTTFHREFKSQGRDADSLVHAIAGPTQCRVHRL